MQTTTCPKCGAPCDEGAGECQQCGIVFEKYRRYQERLQAKEQAEREALTVSLDDAGADEAVAAQPSTEKRPFSYLNSLIAFLIICVFFASAAIVILYKERHKTVPVSSLASLSSVPATVPNTYSSSRDLSNMAFIQCKNIVKDNLKSPSTADFPFLDFQVNAAPDNLYIVLSYVDAQNGYGAMIRNNWRCKLRYVGGDEADPRSWTLVDLRMH